MTTTVNVNLLDSWATERHRAFVVMLLGLILANLSDGWMSGLWSAFSMFHAALALVFLWIEHREKKARR